MRAVFGARKVYHAIDAGESGTSTAVSVRVELLLGQNVTAALWNRIKYWLDGTEWIIQLGVWERREDKETNSFVAMGGKGWRAARNRRPNVREDQPDQKGRGVWEEMEGWCVKVVLSWW